MKLRHPSPYVVVAIPTIEARGDAWKRAEAAIAKHTCQPVSVIPSYAPGGWSAGLNEVWQKARIRMPDVFVCGSDDMIPEDDNWLPPLLEALRRGVYPAPTVIDPRWTNYGGHASEVADGTPSTMSTFPTLLGAWCDAVFPLPPRLSYYADNLIAIKLREAGIDCVAVPSSRIRHLWLPEGRGFGLGSEEKAMRVHSQRFTRALEEIGVDRELLTQGLGGPLPDPFESGR